MTQRTNPMLADHPLFDEFHPTKNKGVDPTKISAGTNKKLWWKCKICGWEWEATANSRINGSGCPACAGRVATPWNNLATTNPEFVEEYSSQNILPPNMIIAGTGKKLSWKCKKCGWEWEAKGSTRINGYGCPACSKQVPTPWNNLTVTHPKLLDEYSNKNSLSPDKVLAGTGKKLWWKCKTCRWEWEARGYSRVNGAACPACSNKVTTPWNNIATTNPELVEEYSNKNLSPPNEVIAGSDKKLWWQCRTCGWEWEATGRTRIKGHGCPACSNKVTTPWNNIATTNPELVEEYSNKNLSRPNEVIAGSDKKLWWQCRTCGWEWETKAYNRTRGKRRSNCPSCATKSFISQESLLIFSIIRDQGLKNLITEKEGHIKLKPFTDFSFFDAYDPDSGLYLEYDGEFYHRTRFEADQAKAQAVRTRLKKHCIRIRQGLPPTSQYDVVVDPPFNAEAYAAATIERIKTLFQPIRCQFA